MSGISGAALTERARDAANFIRNATTAQKIVLGFGLLAGCYLVKSMLESWTGTLFLTAACILGTRHLLGRVQVLRDSSSAAPSSSPLSSTLTARPLSTYEITPIKEIGIFGNTRLPPAQEVFSSPNGYADQIWYALPTVVDEFVTSDPSKAVVRSWRPKSYISKQELAYIQFTHWNIRDKRPVIGEIMVHRDIAKRVADCFSELFAAKFTIFQARLVDHFNDNHEHSKKANNSTAFWYQDILKPSSVRICIDINPFFNPYYNHKKGVVAPPGAEKYLDRNLEHAGMIKEGDACHKAFTSRGFPGEETG